jgi:hypothetical protein
MEHSVPGKVFAKRTNVGIPVVFAAERDRHPFDALYVLGWPLRNGRPYIDHDGLPTILGP